MARIAEPVRNPTDQTPGRGYWTITTRLNCMLDFSPFPSEKKKLTICLTLG